MYCHEALCSAALSASQLQLTQRPNKSTLASRPMRPCTNGQSHGGNNCIMLHRLCPKAAHCGDRHHPESRGVPKWTADLPPANPSKQPGWSVISMCMFCVLVYHLLAAAIRCCWQLCCLAVTATWLITLLFCILPHDVQPAVATAHGSIEGLVLLLCILSASFPCACEMHGFLT